MPSNATGDGEVDSLLSRLAEQAMRTAVEPERSRARARFELMMIASRDPELGTVSDGLMDRFVTISEAAVAQVQPVGAPADEELIKKQAFAVVTFLGGFLFRLAYGLAEMDSAKTLERYLHSVIAGVAADHVQTSRSALRRRHRDPALDLPRRERRRMPRRSGRARRTVRSRGSDRCARCRRRQ